MKGWTQLVSGSLMALLSAGLIAGSVLVSLAENGRAVALAPGIPQANPIYLGLDPASSSGQPVNITPMGVFFKSLATPIPTLSPAVECPPQDGWEKYTVAESETLSTLARRFEISETTLQAGSCLENASLHSGQVINIPKPATTRAPARTAVDCKSPPAGWVAYYVRAGDTLYALSNQVGASVAQLLNGNCRTGTDLRTGERIYVPRLPVIPIPTATRRPPPTLPVTTTQPPVTEPPVTEPPVTEPPVTEPPVTEPPVTEPPVTEPPVVTLPVETEPPQPPPPLTEPPLTEPFLTASPEPGGG